MSRNLIRDGYEMDGLILPVPGLHQGIMFKFRPMLAENVSRIFRALEKATGEQTVAVLAKMLVDQISEWSESDENGNPFPITVQNVKLLPYSMFFRMANIVRLVEPSDLAPEKDEEIDEIQRLLEGAESSELALRGN